MHDPPRLPPPRGPVSAHLGRALRGRPGPVDLRAPGSDDDLQLSLYVLYELAHRGFADVDDEWEWEPSLLSLRAALERRFLATLVGRVGPPSPCDPADAIAAVVAMVRHAGGPSLSSWVLAQGTLDHVRELAVHRSAWQLREADGHTWGIPRLTGRAKAARVRIQADEYGGGVETAMHSSLFATTMTALGLDPSYGVHVARIPGVTLATVNLVSLLGLHRRWRGALVGHLAAFEMTSVEPMSRYAATLRRLGVEDDAARFYDVHVEADARHERIAVDDLLTGLLEVEPDLAGDVVFGARAMFEVEARLAAHVLASWRAGRSSLLRRRDELEPAGDAVRVAEHLGGVGALPQEEQQLLGRSSDGDVALRMGA